MKRFAGSPKKTNKEDAARPINISPLRGAPREFSGAVCEQNLCGAGTILTTSATAYIPDWLVPLTTNSTRLETLWSSDAEPMKHHCLVATPSGSRTLNTLLPAATTLKITLVAALVIAGTWTEIRY